MSLKFWILIVLLGLAWGASFFFNEILLRELGPFAVAFGRVGTGALGCWIWLIGTGKNVAIPLRVVAALCVFALVQYALPLTIYPVTQQFITSSAAGIINATTPIMVVAVSHVWPNGERATWMKSIGVVLGFAGIVILVWPAFAGQGPSDPVAMLATMLAPLCYGIALNLMRSFDGMDRTVLTAWSLTFAAIALGPVMFAVEGVPVITQAETWAALAIIGFALTSAAFILLFWMIPQIGGTNASSITLLTPVSAVLLGAVFLGEPIGVSKLVGMAVILLGLLFIDGRLPRRVLHHQPIG